MADFTIRLPRVSVAISEATISDFLVEEGQTVQEGEPLFLMETEKVETEINAGASGVVHWTGEVGTTYDIGTEIGVIHSSD